MPLHFTKMHGLGNDYIYVSLFDQAVSNPRNLARRLSDRHTGVGGDGLILIAPPDLIIDDAGISARAAAPDGRSQPAVQPADDAHVRMIMFNADGSRAQMCGNGIRCVAKYAFERGLAPHNPMRVATDVGVLSLDLTVDAAGRVTQVRVDMGEPILDPKRIPVAVSHERVVAMALPYEDKVLSVTCVSMGNPHAVLFTPQVAAVPLKTWGPRLEQHPLFPQRINVHFVQVVRPDLVKMATWERGTGLTQACGTGASAVCVAGVLNRLTERTITAQLPGGALKLEWDAATNHVFMTGPATEVFTGSLSSD